MTAWNILESSDKESQLRYAQVRVACEHVCGGLSQLLMQEGPPTVGSTISWSGGPRMYKTLAKNEPVKEPVHWSMVPHGPILTSFVNGLWTIRWNKTFQAQSCFGSRSLSQQQKGNQNTILVTFPVAMKKYLNKREKSFIFGSQVKIPVLPEGGS